MVGIKRIKVKAKKLKGIPKIKLKKLGRPFAKDVKKALRVGKKISRQRFSTIRKKSKGRKKK